MCGLLCVSQEEFCSLWYDLQKDKPELLGFLEGILVHAVSHLQDSVRERESLEQALRRCQSAQDSTCCEMFIFDSKFSAFNFLSPFRRENDHDQIVRSIYEEMESQIREEREKWQSQVQMCAFNVCLLCHLNKVIILMVN